MLNGKLSIIIWYIFPLESSIYMYVCHIIISVVCSWYVWHYQQSWYLLNVSVILVGINKTDAKMQYHFNHDK